MLFSWPMVPGQPLLAGVQRLTEGTHYNYTCHGHTLLLCLDRPTDADIRALDREDAAFALLVREGVVFLLAKIGERPWTGSHYNWWINPPHLRPEPAATPQARHRAVALKTCLADAGTGLVAAVQTFVLGSDFGGALHEAVARQIQDGLDPWLQLHTVSIVLSHPLDSNRLLKEAVCVQFCPVQAQSVDPANGEAGLTPMLRRRCASLQ